MRWQKTASPRHCQALALENDTARQVQVFEAACQSDGAVNRSAIAVPKVKWRWRGTVNSACGG
ncbi:hypothetical protein EC2722950_3228 [Escherichia coli 2722950]|nr:hypothetical protein EC2722950_3228 [Escherichia coli 2722950]